MTKLTELKNALRLALAPFVYEFQNQHRPADYPDEYKVVLTMTVKECRAAVKALEESRAGDETK